MENQVKHRKWRNKLRARDGPKYKSGYNPADRIRLIREAKEKFDARKQKELTSENSLENSLSDMVHKSIQEGDIEMVKRALHQILWKIVNGKEVTEKEHAAVEPAQTFIRDWERKELFKGQE